MSGASLYTPWVETGKALRDRHIDREEELAVIAEGAQRLIQGSPALPLYFFGPRGTGKSHLLALAVQELRPKLTAAGVAVHTLPEDIPQCSSANELWRRISRGQGHARWLEWGLPQPVVAIARALVVIEGFDRHLRALGISGCRDLRALLRDHPGVWLVTTGARLPDELTDKDAAFFGTFDTRSIQPFEDSQAGALLDRQVSGEVRTLDRWPSRRAAALTLAGGNPRALIALADALSAAPHEEIAQRLLRVLDDFTAHFQLRFQDLNAHEQQLVELLSLAPRALGPTEVASRLGGVPPTWSTVAGRLQEQGVLRVQQEGRNAWYRISEPLFRYWLEYRGAPWSETRVAWLGRLLELVLGPAELVEAWTTSEDSEVRSAALGAVKRLAEARTLAWFDRVRAIDDAIGANQPQLVAGLVREAVAVQPTASQAWSLVMKLGPTTVFSAAAPLATALTAGRCPTLGGLVKGLNARAEARTLLSELLRDGVAELARVNPEGHSARQQQSLRLVVALLANAVRTKNTQGYPWKLKTAEKASLLRLPFLRSRFYSAGRLPSHSPLLALSDLLMAPLSPEDGDLAELLATALARGHSRVADRVLATLDLSKAPNLPWCAWPGRRLPLDLPTLARVLARNRPYAIVTWLGALSDSTDDAFGQVISHLKRLQAVPLQGGDYAYQLALTGLALRRPDRRDLVREALGVPWKEIFDRVDLLERQLREGDRGPLHPELARIKTALGEIGAPPNSDTASAQS